MFIENAIYALKLTAMTCIIVSLLFFGVTLVNIGACITGAILIFLGVFTFAFTLISQ